MCCRHREPLRPAPTLWRKICHPLSESDGSTEALAARGGEIDSTSAQDKEKLKVGSDHLSGQL